MRKIARIFPRKLAGKNLLMRMLRRRASAVRAEDGRPAALDRIPRPETIPLELTGKWIAWSTDGLKILGHGDSIAEARKSGGGSPDLTISWVPPADGPRSSSTRPVAPSA